MKLYYKTSKQLRNCQEFTKFMARFPWANFTQPNEEKAPWHIQCIIETNIGDTLQLDFWPHKLKGHYDGKTVEGIDKLRGIMSQAIDDSQDDIEVVE